jgi:hypothetical protein
MTLYSVSDDLCETMHYSSSNSFVPSIQSNIGIHVDEYLGDYCTDSSHLFYQLNGITMVPRAQRALSNNYA